jgi:hypothetical protein
VAAWRKRKERSGKSKSGKKGKNLALFAAFAFYGTHLFVFAERPTACQFALGLGIESEFSVYGKAV